MLELSKKLVGAEQNIVDLQKILKITLNMICRVNNLREKHSEMYTGSIDTFIREIGIELMEITRGEMNTIRFTSVDADTIKEDFQRMNQRMEARMKEMMIASFTDEAERLKRRLSDEAR